MAPTEPKYITIGAGETGSTVASCATDSYCIILIGSSEPLQSTSISNEYIIDYVTPPPLEYRFYHDYPMLIRWHRGPIVRQLKSKDRPAVVRRHNNTNDRRINKRKTYLRSL